jgi:hypothetical protein
MSLLDGQLLPVFRFMHDLSKFGPAQESEQNGEGSGDEGT